MLNKLDRWLLNRIARKAVIQGPTHTANIEDFYAILNLAAIHEFYEDNRVTLDDFLSDCHSNSLDIARRLKINS